MSRPHFFLLLLATVFPHVALGDNQPDGTADKVSYYQHVRPILQANCQGCHQPAKAKGDYVMTAFDHLTKGGESEEPAIVAGKPDESYLIELITPTDGEAEMPQGKPPLAELRSSAGRGITWHS
jgi:mono/diheme cytochrome c family protein